MAERNLNHDKSAKVIANNKLDRKTPLRNRGAYTDSKTTKHDTYDS